MSQITQLFAASAVVLAGCSADAPPLPTDHQMSQHAGVSLSSLTEEGNGKALAALRQLTASFHDLDAARAAHYALLTAPPLTAPDGCISSAAEGGMGYHYTRGNNLADDAVTLLDPEFLVYAPTDAPRQDGVARRRLAALDYFIPYSTRWPGPDDPRFERAPTVHDFASMQDLPDVTFAPSRFNGWMFHVWLFEHNPAGTFANWNTAVPLCEGSTF